MTWPMIWNDSALLLVGHGSATFPEASAPTRLLADRIRATGSFAEVACCFHKERPFLDEGPDLVASRRVFVVPNFIGEGYYTRELIPRSIGPGASGREIIHTRPVGTHPAIAGLIAGRAVERAAAMSWQPEECSLLLVGHGSGRPGSAAVTPERIAAAIRQDCRFAEVATAYLEQAPFARGWRGLVGHSRVLVAPLLLSQGLHARQDLPALFGTDAVLCPLLGSEAALVELVLDKVREALHPAP